MHQAHENFLGSGSVPEGVRDLVAESWLRSVAAGVDVDRPDAPCALAADELLEHRAAHPLAEVFPLLYDVLGRAAEECDSLMAVGDCDGRLLWVCGRPGVLALAEQINFVEGAAWDEDRAGTNAPGTALRLDAPVQIRAGEHFRRAVQPWTCAAAPIHDPVTQAVLGVVDVTGTDVVAGPQTMAMVRAAARMAEAELGRLAAIAASRTAPSGPSGSSRPSGPSRGTCTVQALGRPDCRVDVDGRSVRLSHRHSEILVLLADAPDGVSGDELAVELYPGDVRTSTVRAELARMRSLLGQQVLVSRPYRLARRPHCDWLEVSRLLDARRVADAVCAYRGPLLPHSDAPGVIERRDRLERDLRRAVFASGQLELMVAWTRSRWGADDLRMWRQQARLLPAGSPLLPLALAEVRRLDRALGV